MFPQGDHIGEVAIRREAYNFYFQDTWENLAPPDPQDEFCYEVTTPIHEGHKLTSGAVFT